MKVLCKKQLIGIFLLQSILWQGFLFAADGQISVSELRRSYACAVGTKNISLAIESLATLQLLAYADWKYFNDDQADEWQKISDRCKDRIRILGVNNPHESIAKAKQKIVPSLIDNIEKDQCHIDWSIFSIEEFDPKVSKEELKLHRITELRSFGKLRQLDVERLVLKPEELEKKTTGTIKRDFIEAIKQKDFDTAFKNFLYLELCVEADWIRLTEKQWQTWNEMQPLLMREVYTLYNGPLRFSQLFTQEKEGLQARNELLEKLENGQMDMDVSKFLGGEPIVADALIMNDRIMTLKHGYLGPI